jgi:hypothetical protein
MPNDCQAHNENCPHADRAAEKAVKKTFAILGVDIDEPKEVREFQESLRFSEKLRGIADKSLTAFVIVFVVSAAGIFIYGVKMKLTGKP